MRAAFNEASIILKGSIVFPLFLPKIVILYYFFERQLLQIISDFLLRWRILVVLLRHFCSRPSTVDQLTLTFVQVPRHLNRCKATNHPENLKVTAGEGQIMDLLRLAICKVAITRFFKILQG
mmetsp:Transcript_48716/g.96451  ORF Transcript_48716/g.96451 Transcript_48716/m.96451 type:complete len:122 (+) Transcript_48716:173-538(+)